jgi:hypothetical protein
MPMYACDLGLPLHMNRYIFSKSILSGAIPSHTVIYAAGDTFFLVSLLNIHLLTWV